MQQTDFTYAVARVRYRETLLMTNSDLETLLSSKSADDCLRMLRDRGWGDSSEKGSADELIHSETEKLWAFIDEIVPDRSTFDFMLVSNDYHNLKVAVKAITRDADPEGMFLHNALFDSAELYDALKKREYERLPDYLQPIAKEALSALLQTSDGQLCDMMIDKACLERIYQLGSADHNEIIRLYCELTVAAADIKIAVRASRTQKERAFILSALAPCDSLDVERLADAAYQGFDEILSYLGDTDYRSACDAIKRSLSAFEKWCDDYLIEVLKPQKWEPFTIGPVIAYIIARQNEIKAVRMILSAKINHLSDSVVRERLREMYV